MGRRFLFRQILGGRGRIQQKLANYRSEFGKSLVDFPKKRRPYLSNCDIAARPHIFVNKTNEEIEV